MSEWIPIKKRPLTELEKNIYPEGTDFIYDCVLPDDGQDVLITNRFYDVCVDTFCRDEEGCYFETWCDDDDVLAWMPSPEPYKDPLDHRDEPIRCKAENCSPEGCKHCAGYKPIDFGETDGGES